MFKVIRAMVILSTTCDKISLFTDFPCPFVKEFLPSQEPLVLSFDATYDTGIEYVRKNFNIEPEVVNTRPPPKHVWKRYDTGIGYGGYKECVNCGINTYSFNPGEVCEGKK